ncbi:hypothetical protein EMCRGX_G004759 [Ephydatia muelleri]
MKSVYSSLPTRFTTLQPNAFCRLPPNESIGCYWRPSVQVFGTSIGNKNRNNSNFFTCVQTVYFIRRNERGLHLYISVFKTQFTRHTLACVPFTHRQSFK